MSQIYNGSFVLGDISGTTLSAGDGIKIDTSVPGVIGISNDETLLYSATPYVYGSTSSGASFQLSEDISGFEKVEFYVNVRKGDDGFTYYDSHIVDNPLHSNYMAFQYGPYPENNVTANWMLLRAYVNGKKCDVSAAYNSYTSTQNPNWGNKWFPGSLYKVVGINRINGGV